MNSGMMDGPSLRPKNQAAAKAMSVNLETIEATEALGARIARLLQAGDVVLLRGDLGAGKSELARAIVRAAARAPVDVPSPTFTLVQSYDTPGLKLTHADLYRIASVADLEELGLDEARAEGALIVEWPDKAAGVWPPSRLEIALDIVGAGPARKAALTGFGDWADRMAALRETA